MWAGTPFARSPATSSSSESRCGRNRMPISFRSSSVQWARSRPRSGTTMHTSAYLPSPRLCSTHATSPSLRSTSGVVARPATTDTESSGEMRLSSDVHGGLAAHSRLCGGTYVPGMRCRVCHTPLPALICTERRRRPSRGRSVERGCAKAGAVREGISSGRGTSVQRFPPNWVFVFSCSRQPREPCALYGDDSSAGPAYCAVRAQRRRPGRGAGAAIWRAHRDAWHRAAARSKVTALAGPAYWAPSQASSSKRWVLELATS